MKKNISYACSYVSYSHDCLVAFMAGLVDFFC